MGCFVETERKHGVSAGMRLRLRARVERESRDGSFVEAIVEDVWW